MKKGIAILLVAILVLDLTSCISYQQLSTQQDFEAYEIMDHIQVLDIHSRTDGIIEFNEKYPGKMEDKQVYGFEERHFPYNSSNSIIYNAKEAKATYLMNNGIRYKIISQDKSGFVCIATDTTRTPYSDIALISVKKNDPLKTSLLIIGVSTILLGITGYLIGSNFTIYTQGM